FAPNLWTRYFVLGHYTNPSPSTLETRRCLVPLHQLSMCGNVAFSTFLHPLRVFLWLATLADHRKVPQAATNHLALMVLPKRWHEYMVLKLLILPLFDYYKNYQLSFHHKHSRP